MEPGIPDRHGTVGVGSQMEDQICSFGCRRDLFGFPYVRLRQSHIRRHRFGLCCGEVVKHDHLFA